MDLCCSLAVDVFENCYVSFMLVFHKASKMVKCSTVSKAFSQSMEYIHSGRLHSTDFSMI